MTEYVIIPICVPTNDEELIKVSNIPVSIWDRDDSTGRLIDTVEAEQIAMAQAARIYGWTGNLDFIYGFGTAGGIIDKDTAEKTNQRIIGRLQQCTRRDYMRGRY